jgi:hypothetical protein
VNACTALALVFALAGCGNPAAGPPAAAPSRTAVMRPRPAIRLPAPPHFDDDIADAFIASWPPKSPAARRRLVARGHPIARGDHAFARGDLVAALAAYSAVAETDRDADYALYRRAWCELGLVQWEPARTSARDALARTTDEDLRMAIRRELLPRVLAIETSWTEAIDELRRAGGDVEDRLALAFELVRVARHRDAIAVLDTVEPSALSCAAQAWLVVVMVESWPPITVPVSMRVLSCRAAISRLLAGIAAWHERANADPHVRDLGRILRFVERTVARSEIDGAVVRRALSWCELAISLLRWNHARDPATWVDIADGFVHVMRRDAALVPPHLAARAALDAWSNAVASGPLDFRLREIARRHVAALGDVVDASEIDALARLADDAP